MVSCFHHLVGGTKVSSFITFHHISSPSWWHEDEFLLHLVGGMKESTGYTFHHLVGGMKESTGCTFHHLVGGMKMSSFFTWLVA